jgi:hypothetical protein
MRPLGALGSGSSMFYPASASAPVSCSQKIAKIFCEEGGFPERKAFQGSEEPWKPKRRAIRRAAERTAKPSGFATFRPARL